MHLTLTVEATQRGFWDQSRRALVMCASSKGLVVGDAACADGAAGRRAVHVTLTGARAEKKALGKDAAEIANAYSRRHRDESRRRHPRRPMAAPRPVPASFLC